jgi:hypothetical protein
MVFCLLITSIGIQRAYFLSICETYKYMIWYTNLLTLTVHGVGQKCVVYTKFDIFVLVYTRMTMCPVFDRVLLYIYILVLCLYLYTGVVFIFIYWCCVYIQHITVYRLEIIMSGKLMPNRKTRISTGYVWDILF